MAAQEKSSQYSPDFLIGQNADKLVEMFIDVCGKKKDKGGKFPYYLYNNYVDKMMNSVLDAHEHIFTANTLPIDSPRRREEQIEACSCLIRAGHLIRIAYNKKWISEKQVNNITNKCSSLFYQIKRWMK